jgi:ribosomal protein S18 acetylase RimI-like enzyme
VPTYAVVVNSNVRPHKSPPVAPVTFSEFTPSATDPLVRMWRASFEHGVGITNPHPIEGQVEFFLANVVPNNRVRVAWREGELVGFMASNHESISQLYVNTECLRQGIGSSFVHLAQAESSGSLWLFTFAKNQRACQFYERHGFTIAARGFEPFWQLEDVKYIWSAASVA